MKAILLAGGKGTRLRPLTIHTPKPIVPIFNRPFLHYQIDLLKQVPEIDEVILSLNYQPRRIEEIFGDGDGLGIRVRYVVEPTPLGTGGAIRYAGDSLHESVVVFNGDVLTQVDLARGAAAAPRAQGQGDDRPDAGRQSDAPTAWSRPTRDGNIQRFLEKPSADEITCNTINAGIYVLEPDTFDRIPKDTAWSIERSFFPSLIERGETFVAYVYDGYWIDIGTPDKYMQVHRDIMDGRYQARAVRRRRRRRPGSRRTRASRTASSSRALLHRRRRRRQGGRAHRSLQRHRPPDATSKSTRSIDGSIVWPNSRIGQEAVVRGVDPRPQLPHRPQRHRRRRRRARRQDRRHRLQPTLSTDCPCDQPDIFKAYDVRGALSRAKSTRRPRAQIGAAFVAYLKAKRIAVSRDMRLSSPALAAAFIDGARAQGADVVDYGMIGDRHALLRRRARRPRRRRRRSPRRTIPKQYNGIKMVRQEAFPLSGDAGHRATSAT